MNLLAEIVALYGNSLLKPSGQIKTIVHAISSFLFFNNWTKLRYWHQKFTKFTHSKFLQ